MRRLLSPGKFVSRFAAADDAKLMFCYQDFGGARARIVVGGLHEAVGAGAPERQDLAWFGHVYGPIVEKAITGFADRTNDIRAD